MSDAPEWKNMADWSDLPDVYVTKVECQQGMFWRVEASSVPMAIGPEVRLIRADVSAARIADLERQLAEARAVKPLGWDDFDGVGAKASAFYQANYLIQKWKSEGRFEVSMSYPGYQTGYDGPRWHDTLEAAKAAAQADYAARILSALKDPTP